MGEPGKPNQAQVPWLAISIASPTLTQVQAPRSRSMQLNCKQPAGRTYGQCLGLRVPRRLAQGLPRTQVVLSKRARQFSFNVPPSRKRIKATASAWSRMFLTACLSSHFFEQPWHRLLCLCACMLGSAPQPHRRRQIGPHLESHPVARRYRLSEGSMHLDIKLLLHCCNHCI